MPAPPLQTFTLTPHPVAQSQTVRRIGGRISRTSGGLHVSYVLEGELDRLLVPERQTARFADNLWRHTCFELFVARQGEAAYHEFNFSPSSEWTVYAFTRVREQVPLDAGIELAEIDPHVTVCRSADKLELDAVVRLDRLSTHYARARLAVGVSAVVEDEAGRLSYWALKHPLDKPDFHHPDAFVLELDEIRN